MFHRELKVHFSAMNVQKVDSLIRQNCSRTDLAMWSSFHFEKALIKSLIPNIF